MPAQRSQRGTRIPGNFAVAAAMVAWATANCPEVSWSRETEKFRDYWTAKSGRDATKCDWVAAWRYWMSNAQERAGGRGTGRAAPAPDRRQEARSATFRHARQRAEAREAREAGNPFIEEDAS